jgi:hypothetical protein
MAGIPHTYYDGNPEDRDTGADFWAWLEQQPVHAWLFYARGANWDSGETIFEKMVAHPRCDLAIASWIFWANEPAYWLGGSKMPPPGGMLRTIIDRCNGDGFPSGAVHYQRVEVAYNAFLAARELRNRKDPPPFDIPLALIQSFEGRNPPIGPFSKQIENDLTEIFDDVPGHHSLVWGSFFRSDAEYFNRQRRGGNWWYEPALRLPEKPEANANMSALGAIEAVFGKHRPNLRRIKREGRRRQRKYNPVLRQRWANFRIAFYMAIFAIVAIGGSMIAHWLRTGTW